MPTPKKKIKGWILISDSGINKGCPKIYHDGEWAVYRKKSSVGTIFSDEKLIPCEITYQIGG